MGKVNEMFWTDTMDKMLKAMLANGDSASVIAQAVGRTRNAVIGRCHRLGVRKIRRVAGPRPAVKRNRSNTPRPARIAVTQRLDMRPTMAPAMVTATVVEQTRYQAPRDTRKTLLELVHGDCRWPCGDVGAPDFFFCGAPQAEGYSYCSHHCRIAYQPTSRLNHRRAEYAERAAA